MRTIKFRFWKSEDSKWINFPNRAINSFEPIIPNVYTDNDYFIIEQFTGLLDKEGREIYEGDIVDSCYYYDYEEPWGGQNSALDDFRGKIEYDSENACFYINAPALRSYKKLFSEIELKETKIIGNIHETPSLLN